MRLRHVIIAGEAPDQAWRGIPGIEVLPSGRLFVSWFSGGTHEPHAENRVCLQHSEDGGETFSAPQVMADPPGDTRAFDPCLWLDPRGVLWYLWNQGNARTATHEVFARLSADPAAEGPEWSEPRRLGFAVPFAFRLNKPTVLSTGVWVMPVCWSTNRTQNWFTQPPQYQGVALSSDQGESWELHGEVEAPPWTLENMIVERRDGSLVMYMRTGAGVLWQSDSADGGRTWSPGCPTTIVNPGSRFFLRVLPSGRWLYLSNPEADSRIGLIARLSADEGVSWGPPLVLDERAEVSYPDTAWTPDGTIYAVHDRERYGAREILLSIFREEDLPAP